MWLYDCAKLLLPWSWAVLATCAAIAYLVAPPLDDPPRTPRYVPAFLALYSALNGYLLGPCSENPLALAPSHSNYPNDPD